jgi:hypothetical protein
MSANASAADVFVWTWGSWGSWAIVMASPMWVHSRAYRVRTLLSGTSWPPWAHSAGNPGHGQLDRDGDDLERDEVAVGDGGVDQLDL